MLGMVIVLPPAFCYTSITHLTTQTSNLDNSSAASCSTTTAHILFMAASTEVLI